MKKPKRIILIRYNQLANIIFNRLINLSDINLATPRAYIKLFFKY